MSTSVSFNGSSYSVPATGEDNWGGSNKVDGLLISLANNALSKAGGTFALTAEVDFSSTAGLKSLYYKSRGTNVATSGEVRLANAEGVYWRNNANGANLGLTVSASDRLQFDSLNVPTISSTDTLTNKTLTAPTITAAVIDVIDSSFSIKDNSDATKIAKFQCSGITTGTTRTYTLPDVDDTVVGLAATQTLTNKTLTSPVITSFVGPSSSTITPPSATGTLATLAGTETLTNKTLTAPTISSPTFTTSVTVAESSTPSTPSSGYAAIYPKSNGKWYSKNDSGLEALLGSGSGSGAKNYLLRDDSAGGQHNGDFEVGADEDTLGSTVGSNVVGWQLFNTTMTGLVPTGTITNGASSITLAKLDSNAITLLGGTLSLVIGTSGGTAISAGHGFLSTSFTTEACDRATVLNFSFDYYPYIATGCDFSGTSANTFHVYIYDVLNAAWIQPVGVYGMNTTGRPGKCIGSFQTGSTGGVYKFAVICANATTSAAKTISFDNFVVSPEKAVYGTAVKSPALAGFLQDYAGTSAPTGWLLCDGSAVSRTTYADLFTNIGTTWGVGDGSTTFNIPNFQRRVAVGSGGSGTATLANSVGSTGGSETHTLTSAEMPSHTHSVSFRGTSGSVSPAVIGAGHAIDSESKNTSSAGSDGAHNNMQPSAVVYKIIKAYNDQVATFSNDTDTRVVAALYESNTGRSISNNAANTGEFLCEDKIFDTHNFVSASTAIATIPVSGTYEVSAGVVMASGGGWSAGEVLSLRLYKNGTLERHIASTYTGAAHGESVGATGTTMVSCIAGDTLEVRLFQNSGGALATGGNENDNWYSYKRLSGPSVIAASEDISCRYSLSADQSISNSALATVLWNTKQHDSHGAMNTSTGVWTAPSSGKFSVSVISGWAANATNGRRTVIRKNSTIVSNITWAAGHGVATNFFSGSDLVQCIAGDTIDIQVFQDSGGSLNLLGGSSAYSSISITKIATY